MNYREKIFLQLINDKLFEVTPNGIVTNLSTNNVVGSGITGGYYAVTFKHNEKILLVHIHRVVWLLFGGIIPPKFNVNHKDGNKLNNCISNLECIISSQNALYSLNHNLAPKGEQRSWSKLSENDIRWIREQVALGVSRYKIAQTLDINIGVVTSIIRGRSWVHVS